MITLRELREMVLDIMADHKAHTRQELISHAQVKFNMGYYDADQRTTSAIIFLLKKGALVKLQKGIYSLHTPCQSEPSQLTESANVPSAVRNPFPSKEVVARVREAYPAGCRVELLSMDDPFTKLRPGDQGTVSFVDDTATVFVRWDSGSGLGVVYGEDKIRRI